MALRQFFVEADLGMGAQLALPTELSHRLHRVLRLGAGAVVGLCNGRDGLWEATLNDDKARSAVVGRQVRVQPVRRGLTLVLCVPKRDAWESALRQATELGVTEIIPVLSARCVPTKLNMDRARELVREAAEQCEVLVLPVLREVAKFENWLAGLQTPVAWAYERAEGDERTLRQNAYGALLVGPEGGFGPAEVAALRAHPLVQTLSLGDTILRVDTAVVAGLQMLRIESKA